VGVFGILDWSDDCRCVVASRILPEKTESERGKVTSIICLQEVEDVTAIPSTTTGVRKRLRMEDSSILYDETIPPSLQSPLHFETTTNKFLQRLYILLETANPCTILQMTVFGEEHNITIIFEDEELLLLLQIFTSLFIPKKKLENEVELPGSKNIKERSSKLLLTDTFVCTNRQAVRSSKFFKCLVECFRILH
jgi:hypothetical protein